MEQYRMRCAEEKDIEEIVRIYNSNETFLINHLGSKEIDNTFIAEELKSTVASGFQSLLLLEGERGIGVCDYRSGEDVYLSLLMIDGKRKGKGIGKSIYQRLEHKFKSEGGKYIRIDVVDDYKGNVLGFWKKLGFEKVDRVELSWNEKKSAAVVMRKAI